jgi:hypothetical protein
MANYDESVLKTLQRRVGRLSRLAAIVAAAGFVFLQSLWLNLGISAFPTTENADPEYCRGIGANGSVPHSHAEDCPLCPVCQTMRLGAGAVPLPAQASRLPLPGWRMLPAAVNDNIRQTPKWRQRTNLPRGPPALGRSGAALTLTEARPRPPAVSPGPFRPPQTARCTSTAVFLFYPEQCCEKTDRALRPD